MILVPCTIMNLFDYVDCWIGRGVYCFIFVCDIFDETYDLR
jgi:hypothetical protein